MRQEAQECCKKSKGKSFQGMIFFVTPPSFPGAFKDEEVQPKERDKSKNSCSGKDCEETGVGAAR